MKFLKQLLKRKLLRVLIVMMLLIVNAVGWLAHWSNEPATTTIHIANNSTVADTKPAYQPFKSKLFASEVPYGWAIRKNTDTSSMSQLVSFPSGSSINHGQVAVTVDTLTAGGLAAVPDYNVRTQDKTSYQKQTTNLPGVSATFLDKNNGPGYTVFMVHGNRYAAVTVSQFATPDDAYTLLEHVISAWKWVE